MSSRSASRCTVAPTGIKSVSAAVASGPPHSVVVVGSGRLVGEQADLVITRLGQGHAGLSDADQVVSVNDPRNLGDVRPRRDTCTDTVL